ncbi:Ldh family oxidoreductase [Aeromicrobium ponti]|uniref:LDH2 family malate/lactate/ureidoglycolate dehydrogenase n=1 Tax=Cytobacillus oceanisediminis TaxID=665099 RepID=A0A562JSC0_9BACI|nr:Ldh family oxidoreductase [Cytobacillus oceanisediminis]TWH85913.1 LDH2 family malate/lactate/ureidoglycolate dehydrogenase [Cytobacillus oceanisediminis]
MITISAEALRKFAYDAFMKVGLNKANASLVSDVLVDADLRGVHSHGVQNLPRWARGFLKGHLELEVTHEDIDEGPITVIDGQGSLGVLASDIAMDAAIKRAKKYGIGIAGVKNSSHFGPAAYYTMKALHQHQIGFCTTNGPAVMAPWGGKDALLSNNPFSYAIPAGDEPPIVLDMACSVSARGRIRMMARENETLPEGWAITKDGEPTTDPREAVEGTVLPFGGYKGYGIAVINEILSAALTGALFSFEVGGISKGPAESELQNHEQAAWGCGHVFGAIDINRFGNGDNFQKRVAYLSRTLRESPTAKGHERIYLPGEIEFELKKKREVDGIPLKPTTVSLINTFARDEIGIMALESYCSNAFKP